LKEVEGATAEHSDEDWYTNLLWLERQKCMLLAHAGTLFSVFVPGVHKADLAPIGASIVALIHNELRAESLPLNRFGVLDPGSVELAKTASRTYRASRPAISFPSSWPKDHQPATPPSSAGTISGLWIDSTFCLT